MYLPNYKDGSLANLMGSILQGCGNASLYKPLKILKPGELKPSRNVVLLLIDGMGYDFFIKHCKKQVLRKHLRGSISSMFPSTTGACIPTLLTGVAPQQHASVGWHVFLKEIGQISAVLPFMPRLG